ncbi:MAG: hypothetical protein ACK46M_26420, partial [Planctomyces sp.]
GEGASHPATLPQTIPQRTRSLMLAAQLPEKADQRKLRAAKSWRPQRFIRENRCSSVAKRTSLIRVHPWRSDTTLDRTAMSLRRSLWLCGQKTSRPLARSL